MFDVGIEHMAKRVEQTIGLMAAFAERTERTNRRYLWTDAFAVCNYLGLARSTGDTRYDNRAIELVDLVHQSLGRHRPDDARGGFISGLSEEEAAAHPTAGGLRVGKDLPERRPDEPYDDELEWERDGQYFHYLTKWMHALDLVARATGRAVYAAFARELAEVAHRAFVTRDEGDTRPRMYWKMSVDLSRPLVPSMGQHDPLDGLVTYCQLSSPSLGPAIEDFARMLEVQDLTTSDPLGIGGLLTDAVRVNQLVGKTPHVDAELRDRLLRAAILGLEAAGVPATLDGSSDRRLAFRELGLAIGVEAALGLREPAALIGKLARYEPLARRIVEHWSSREHQHARSWLAHRDINEVMLATALAPDGFVTLPKR